MPPLTVISVRDLASVFAIAPCSITFLSMFSKGEILGFVGGSGSGKSVLLRTIIGLLPKRSGTIEVFGKILNDLDDEARARVATAKGRSLSERRIVLVFNSDAERAVRNARVLASFRKRARWDCGYEAGDGRAIWEDANKFPSELSGGMTKRVALARALALDPEVVFLDEPTSGLDPISAGDFDSLIRTLQRTLGLTVFMVTHDLNSLHAVCDRIAVLARRNNRCGRADIGNALQRAPWVKSYFRGQRGQLLGHRTCTIHLLEAPRWKSARAIH